MRASIHSAVQALYEASSSHAFPGEFDDSYHTLDPEVAARVLARPVRELSRDDADELFRVLWDDGPAFKHFLPRLIELAAAPWEPHHWPDLPELLETARRLKVFVDTPELYAPIVGVIESLWAFLYDSEAPAEHVEDILCGSAWCWDSLADRLSTWLQTPRPGAQVSIAGYLLFNAEALRTRRRLTNSDRWANRPAQEMEVCEWLRSAALWKHLCELAVPSTAHPSLVEACSLLNQLHAAPTFA